MYYVAMHKGLLCWEEARGYYLTFDIRWATPFSDFVAADKAAREAGIALHDKLDGITYYAILTPATASFK